MEIFTDIEGAFQRILNYDIILLKWRKVKEKMSSYYKGEKSEKIISSIDRMFSNIENIENAMKDDLFFSIFFAPIYKVYDKDAKSTCNRNFPILPFQPPISFSIEQSINENLTDDGKKILEINGICNDRRTLEDIRLKRFLPIDLNSAKPAAAGEVELTYKLEAEDNSIFSIVGYIKLGTAETDYKKIVIEVYNLQKSQDIKPLLKRILPNGKDEEEEYQKYLEKKNRRTVMDVLLGRKK